jgi:DeoR family transcriptional regulator, fructose operon transcriptional repressor
MLATERHDLILRLVAERGSVTTLELMSALDASESTVRRDLDALSSQRKIVRVHGGACAPKRRLVVQDSPVAQKRTQNLPAKERIAAYAATLIGPDDFVYVDAGSSTMLLVEHLVETGATFVTNSLPHAQALLAKGEKTYLLGGMVKPVTEAVVGPDAIEALGRMHFTVGFWGTNGISPEAGFTTPEISEARVKEASLRQAQSAYVLADSSKFGEVSLVTFARFDQAAVITEHVDPDGSFGNAPNIVNLEEEHQ